MEIYFVLVITLVITAIGTYISMVVDQKQFRDEFCRLYSAHLAEARRFNKQSLQMGISDEDRDLYIRLRNVQLEVIRDMEESAMACDIKLYMKYLDIKEKEEI